MSPILRVQTLGGFQAFKDEQPLQGFASDKVRLLLAYLIVEPPQPHRRESLAALFWPHASPAEARANLRWALSNLRKIIGDREADIPFLLTTRQTVQCNPSADIRSDVADFMDRQKRSGTEHLEQAVSLYGGEFLAGLSSKNSLPLDEWLLLRRESLARMLVETLQKLVQYYLQCGEYQKALPYARRFVEMEPWQEQGHRQLMRLLAATGQRNAALAQYQRCAEILSHTLGVEPERATTSLYQQILQDSQSTTVTPPHKNALPLMPLVGRRRELREIQSFLRKRDCRLLTITGPGGIGKTRLALELLNSQVGCFTDGIFIVPLANVDTPDAVVPSIAEALHFSFPRTDHQRTQLLNYIQGKEILLVLDNFEHLLAGVDVVADLLRVAPSLKIIATSRRVLNIPGEQRYPLLGLDLPSEGSDPSQSDAVKLFIETAQRIHPQFDPTPDDLAAIGEICAIVEGLPLGILLAAAWTDVLSPKEIAAEIKSSFDMLQTDWVGVGDQHRSIRAVIESSWNLLDEGTQHILAALSVFCGDFTRQAASEVSGASLRELQVIVNQSLLTRSPGGRFHLHELLRQFVAEKLASNPQQEQRARDQHSRYYLAALASWVQGLEGPEQTSVLAEMRLEHRDLLAAWRWAIQKGTLDQMLTVAHGFCRYLGQRVLFSEGEELCRDTLSALESATADLSPSHLRLRARLGAWHGYFCRRMGRSQAAVEALADAQASIDQLSRLNKDTNFEQGLVWLIRGRMLESRDRDRARSLYLKSLERFTNAQAHGEVAYVLGYLGSVAWNRGEYAEAAEYYQQTLEIRRTLGDLRGIASAYMSLGITLLDQGKFSQAEPLLREGCRLRRAIGDRLGIADSLRNLGFTRMLMGRFDEAVDLLRKSVAGYLELGLRYGLEMAMLATALGHQGDLDQALVWSQRALDVVRETGYRRALGYVLLTRGELALLQGERAYARGLLNESVEITRQIEQHEDLCRAWIALAFVALDEGNLADARNLLRQVKSAILESQVFIPLLYFIPAMAKWYHLSGDHQKAVEMMRHVSTYDLVRRSRWFAHVLGELNVIHSEVNQISDADALRMVILSA